MPVDLIQRFCSTPLAATLNIDGTALRVSSNDRLLLDRLQRASSATGADIDDATMNWRIVVEEEVADEDGGSDSDSTFQAFAQDGLSFIRLTHRSFLAGDRLSNFGISFVERSLIMDERRFLQSFLPAFRSMLNEMREAHDDAEICS